MKKVISERTCCCWWDGIKSEGKAVSMSSWLLVDSEKVRLVNAMFIQVELDQDLIIRLGMEIYKSTGLLLTHLNVHIPEHESLVA